MRKFRSIIFHIKKLFLKNVLNRDTMNLEVKRCIEKGVRIGANMRAFSPPISKEPFLLEFGDNVTISTGVKFITHDNSVIKIIENATDLFGKIKIGNNCFIGQSSIILPGVELGNSTIVAAGSVVTKSFNQEGAIIGGNPAKIIGNISDYKSKYKNHIFNISGLSPKEVRELIIKNEHKLIKK